MNDAEVFHEGMLDHGGQLDMANLDPNTAEALVYVAQRARGFLQTAAAALPGLPPIHFDFVNNWQFNALTFRKDEKYFIGVFRGAVATLQVLFDRMLADPQTFPFIGDPTAEVSGLPLLPNIGTDFERTVASASSFPRPQDPMRQSTAHKLVELSLDFLTAHEFAHIANGHLDYMASIRGISAIDEVSTAPKTSGHSESALISQTMEMDADSTAVQISLASEWGKIAGYFPKPGPPWTEFYSYPGMVSLQWSWAMSSLFRILGDARLTNGDVALEAYPRPQLRSVMAQHAAGQVPRPQELRTHSTLIGEEPYNIPATIRAAQRDVERIFSQLTKTTDA